MSLAAVWARAVGAIDYLGLEVDVLARDDDHELTGLLENAGFVARGYRSDTTWMDVDDRPEVVPLPEGFVLVDRTWQTKPHPMRRRNGEEVEARLRQCPLYDPALDLAVETAEGQIAGYALFWFDRVTGVGLVEPCESRTHSSGAV